MKGYLRRWPAGRLLPALLLAWLASGAAVGAPVDGLYTATVPVADEGRAERSRGFREALARVLVKVTGDSAIAAREGAATALADAGDAVQQFGYLRRESEAGEPSLALEVGFAPAAVEERLARAGLRFWPRERPRVLVWLAVDDGNRRFLLGADGSRGGALEAALREQAKRRAVPVLLPLLDLEDRRRLGFADLWGGFFEVVLEASERYAPETVAVLRLGREGERWRARWWLHDDTGETASGAAVTGEREAALAAGFDRLVDQLARGLAIRAGGEGVAARLEVRGLEGVTDYARVTEYLEALDVVEAVHPVFLRGSRLRFDLRLRGGPESLRRAIDLGRELAALDADADAGAAGTPTLIYRLRP